MGGGEGEEEGRDGKMGNSSNTSKTCTKLANTGGLEGMTATIFHNIITVEILTRTVSEQTCCC